MSDNFGTEDLGEDQRVAGNCYVGLTSKPLNAAVIMDRVRSPKAGAIVLFAGRMKSRCDY
jgi:molybdopterin synthase catalytic subunit